MQSLTPTGALMLVAKRKSRASVVEGRKVSLMVCADCANGQTTIKKCVTYNHNELISVLDICSVKDFKLSRL
jgi:hypothetical protein